jgi:4-hydroxybenzoate polyprenyltransferase
MKQDPNPAAPPYKGAYTRPFRVDDWWLSKASLLMGFVYLFTWWFSIPLARFIPLALCSIIVIAGFASFGYLVNDFFDKEKDRKAGKKNFLLNKSVPCQICLTVISLLLIALPWLYLPATQASYQLIGLQLSLFLIYSCPPLRLKERGVAGVIADALYAHALPVILAAYTFLLASGSSSSYFPFALLFFWQFMCGVRNILIHQLEDRDTDLRCGTLTLAGTLSIGTSYNILRGILAAELFLCIAFFAYLGYYNASLHYVLAAIFLVSVQDVLRYMHIMREDLPDAPLRYFPNNVYEKWLPVLYLLLLAGSDHYFLIILVLHLAIFNFTFYIQSLHMSVRAWQQIPFLRILYEVVVPIRIILSRAVNYIIYYSFLLFGIDLRRQQISAADYLKKKWRADK